MELFYHCVALCVYLSCLSEAGLIRRRQNQHNPGYTPFKIECYPGVIQPGCPEGDGLNQQERSRHPKITDTAGPPGRPFDLRHQEALYARLRKMLDAAVHKASPLSVYGQDDRGVTETRIPHEEAKDLSRKNYIQGEKLPISKHEQGFQLEKEGPAATKRLARCDPFVRTPGCPLPKGPRLGFGRIYGKTRHARSSIFRHFPDCDPKFDPSCCMPHTIQPGCPPPHGPKYS